jgi:TRAP-type C4-dicarboxylate transport system substrate-binding protein
MLDRLLNGVADIGWALQGLTPQVFVKTSVNEVPFSHATGEEGAVALWRTLQRGVIASDYETVEAFGMSSFVGGAITNRVRPIRALEDVKGLKLMVAGRIRGDMVTALGGVPLAMPIDEIYLALSRGTIDGNYGALTAIRQFRTYEVARHFLDEASSGAAGMLAMGKQRFNSLPEAARAAFRKNSGEALSRALGVSNDGETNRARAFLAELAQQGKVDPVVRLSNEERERWRKVMEPIIDTWVKSVPDGKRVLDAYQAEVAEVRAAKAR